MSLLTSRTIGSGDSCRARIQKCSESRLATRSRPARDVTGRGPDSIPMDLAGSSVVAPLAHFYLTGREW